MTFPNFITYIKNKSNTFNTYNYELNEYKTIEKLEYNINQFEVFKSYANNNQGLKQFADDLIKWRNELLKYKIDYFDNSFVKDDGHLYYKTHSNNVCSILNRYITNTTFEDIELYEESYYSKCNNGGLIYHQPGIYKDITTYDKSSFYPRSLGGDIDFIFPIKKGNISTINDIPKNPFIFGIYNVRVESNDANFNKIFAYSKNNFYTHYSLNFVKFYNKKYNNTVKLTLLNKECLKYQYTNQKVIGSDVFGKWFHILIDIKKKIPKNKLLKHLFSSAWGQLTKSKIIRKYQDEIDNEDLDVGRQMNIEENRYYIKKFEIVNDKSLYHLIDLSEPIYKYQLRLKPFLTSFARVKIAKIALKNIDNVIRIQTDSITYNKSIEIDEFEFIKEEGKSGKNFEVKGNSLIKL